MEPVVSIQFGNVYQRRAPGYVLLSRVYASPCMLWIRSVGEGASMGVEDALLEGYAYSRQPSQFWLGLPAGSYRLTLTCYEPTRTHGPFTVKANDVEVLRDLNVPAATMRRELFIAQAKDGVLRLEFIPAAGQDFILNALVVEGPADARPQPIWQSAPPTSLPGKEELRANAQDDPQTALRRICDWLIAHRRADGFMGDRENQQHSHWYTTSMPIRALLAGYDILGDRRYLGASLAVLDQYVGEQLPNGAWTGTFRGKPTAALAEAEVQQIMIHARQPMSDIGSVVTTVAIASHYAPTPKKEQYVAAVQHFCDHWAARYQEPSGGFTDGPWAKDYFTTIYSCATAIQAAAHAITAVVSGEPHYVQAAERAIAFLLPDWQEDGRMIGRAPHWQVRNRQPFVMEAVYFGDQWYYDEGFITTRHHTRDLALRTQIDRALSRRVHGAQGLLQALEGQVWWPIQDTWNNAKSIGMVQTLLHATRQGMSTPALEEALADMRRFLCTPDYARRMGIMAEDTEHPASDYGYQTWSGMRIESTGFAGMTLAEMIKPGVLYLAAQS